jgi:hypothetical protein
MGIVYFTDGTVTELSRRDTDNFVLRMREGGVRMVHTRDTDPQQVLVISSCPVSHVILDYKHTPQLPNPVVDNAPVKQEDSGPAESGQERAERALVEMKARSDCQHEADKLIYYKIEGSKGTRYFPICSFCGWRGKFVAADTLSEEIKEAALIYQEA